MSTLSDIGNNWDGLANTDPLWAILTDEQKQHGRWDVEAFFATGSKEVRTVMSLLDQIGAKLPKGGSALDFGCGVGRLTLAMSEHFDECVGVDISPRMIELANSFNSSPEKCRYVLNTSSDLAFVENDYFDFVYTSIVLQHIPYKYTKQYIREIVRVLKPSGVAVLQIPDSYIDDSDSSIPASRTLRQKLRLRSRLQRLFWFVEASGYGRQTNIYEINGFRSEMNTIQEDVVRSILKRAGSTTLDVRFTNSASTGFNGNLEYSTQQPSNGYASKQYCVTKARRA